MCLSIALGVLVAPAVAFAAPDEPMAATALDASVRAPSPPVLFVTSASVAAPITAEPLELPRLPLAIAGAAIFISGLIEGRR